MLEEVCLLRKRMAAVGEGVERGRVIFAYIPGHEGCVPNAIADAVAKAHLHEPVARNTVNSAALASRAKISQDGVFTGELGHVEVPDRGAYHEAGVAMQRWVVDMLMQQTTRGLLGGWTPPTYGPT